jgi:type I restriction enzyme S subunit
VIADFKPYPAMKDSGVPWLGQVPVHWEIRRARYLVREVDTRSTTGSEIHLSMSQRLGLVPSTEIEERRLVSASYVGAKLCEPDDLVLNRLKAHLGVFARALQCGLVSPDYTVLRGIANAVSMAFVEYVLRSSACRTELRTRAKGLVEGFWRLYTDDFYQIRLPVPPIAEQCAIVRFLDRVDRRIRRSVRAKQKLIKLLEEQKQAIIHRAVIRGLNPNVRLKPSGVEWLGDVPQHWEVSQIGHFAVVGNGSTPARSNLSYWTEGTYPWLNSSSVNAGAITHADQFVTERALRECHLPLVEPGSVLVAITGQGKTRGTAALLTIASTINQHLAYIRPSGKAATPEYLRLFLIAAYPELRRISDDSGSTKGALTCEDLRHFRVTLVPRDEQDRIVAAVAETTHHAEAAIASTHRAIALLREYSARVIADVVTGKLDVRAEAAKLPDEADEPEPIDEIEALSHSDEAAGDDADAIPEEADG